MEHVGIGDQVQVPLAVAQLLVLEAMPLLGQGQQGLGEELQLQHAHAQLAGLGAHQRPGHGDEVAQIQELQDFPGLLVQVVLPEVGLELLAVLGEVDEHALAHLPDGDDSPHGAHRDGLGFQLLGSPFREVAGDLDRAVGALGLAGIDFDPEGLQLLELLEPDLTVLVLLHGDSKGSSTAKPPVYRRNPSRAEG